MSVKRDLKNGRIAFRSDDEREAYRIVLYNLTELRRLLPREKKVGALKFALNHLVQTREKAKAKLVRRRLEALGAIYPDHKPNVALMHES